MLLEPRPDLAREKLKDRFDSYYPEFEKGEFTIDQIPFDEPSSYPLYQFRAYDDKASEKRVIVKFAPIFEEINEGLIEYNNLKQIYDKLENCNQNIHVARPLDFFEDINALVTEKVDGIRLSNILLKDNSRFGSSGPKDILVKLIESCGRWLSAFHRFTPSSVEVDLNDVYFPLLKRKLSVLQNIGFSAKVCDAVVGVIGDIITDPKFPNILSVIQHGDYGLQNVVVNDDHIYVFDLQREHLEVSYNDIAYFLVTLETMNLKFKYLTYDYSKAKEFKNAFLTGYFGKNVSDLDIKERLLLAIYYLSNMIYRCEKQRMNMLDKFPKQLVSFYYSVIAIRSYTKRIFEQLEEIKGLWEEYNSAY
jgi:hypothetical protein